MWWNTDVAQAVEEKKKRFQKWRNDGSMQSKLAYQQANKMAKKAVAKAMALSQQKCYAYINKTGNTRPIYKLARQIKWDTTEIGKPKIIKNNAGEIVAEEGAVREAWRQYFRDALNQKNDSNRELEKAEPVLGPERQIDTGEVRQALKAMKKGKSGGESEVVTELLKAGKGALAGHITKLFNKIWQDNVIPEDWRKGTIIPVYKKKGDSLVCANYRPVKLLEHTMKVLEKIIIGRLKSLLHINEMQRGFMRGRSTTDAIFLLRQLQQKYIEKNKSLWMAFVDLEKAYDRVPREMVWWALRRQLVPERLIDLIRTLYQDPVSFVRTEAGDTEPFAVDIGLHQGSALSPLLFIVTMEEVTRNIRQGLPWEVLFADDLVLMANTEDQLRDKLLLWKSTLEEHSMKVNMEKTKIMECNRKTEVDCTNAVKWPCAHCKTGVGSNSVQCNQCKKWVHRRCSAVRGPLAKIAYTYICNNCKGITKTGNADDRLFKLTNEVSLEKVTSFAYLGDRLQANGGANQAVRARIRGAWTKWREIAPLLMKRAIALKTRALAYKVYIRSTLIYGSETWALTACEEDALNRTELRMLRWIMGTNDACKSEKHIREASNMEKVGEVIRARRLQWYGHVSRMKADCWIKQCMSLDVEGKRPRGRPPKRWLDIVKADMKQRGTTQEAVQNRAEWRAVVRAKRPTPGNQGKSVVKR
jgi:hypothetical protein